MMTVTPDAAAMARAQLAARIQACARRMSPRYPGIRLQCLAVRVRQIHQLGASLEEAFQIAATELADTKGGWS